MTTDADALVEAPAFMAVWAKQAPDRAAVIFGEDGATLTYGDLEAASNQVARALRSLGVGPGDCVGFMLDNSPEVFAVAWGALRSGVHVVPINFHLTTPETGYIIRNSGAKVVVHHAHLSAVVEPATPHEVTRIVAGEAGAGDTSWEAVMSSQPTDRLPDELAGALMFYSSGTTGRPKGVRRKLPGARPDDAPSLPAYVAQSYRLPRLGRLLVNGPLYHATPLNWSMAMHTVGGTAVVARRFDAARSLAMIEEHAIDVSQWVPTMFAKLLALPQDVRERYDLTSMTAAWHAAAPCPEHVKRRMIGWWGSILNEYYGATEAGATMITSAEWLERPGSVGRPVAGSRILILDPETKQPLPPGVDGQVYFETPAVLAFEYHGEPEKTAEVVHGNLVSPGDVGHLDEDGYLYITDRLVNLIIVGGVNVYPREVEDVLLGHPLVEDVAVVGAPDEVYGERVAAFVQLRAGVNPSDDLFRALEDHARQSLASVKVPKSWRAVPALPRAPNGKLYKRMLDVSVFND